MGGVSRLPAAAAAPAIFTAPAPAIFTALAPARVAALAPARVAVTVVRAAAYGSGRRHGLGRVPAALIALPLGGFGIGAISSRGAAAAPSAT
ncbi:hypothetical protein [Nonomuraea sp. NPDC050202]|uniref:hypothetical protein n=1 Tax=Nonomuraea sp. NPDC050202 TaxID=3155035 RepID=UPI0033CDD624